MSYKVQLRELMKLANDEDKEIIESTINDCGEYIEAVNRMENAINLARFRMEGEEYREHISTLDKRRRAIHNAVIVGVRVINRLCRIYNQELIYKGDDDDRIAIAEFAKAIVDEHFAERKR